MIKALNISPNNSKEVRIAIENITNGSLTPANWQAGDAEELALVKGFAYLLAGDVANAHVSISSQKEYKLYHTNIVDLSELIPTISKKLEEIETPTPEHLAFIQEVLKELEEKSKESFAAMKRKYAMMAGSMESLLKDQKNADKKE